MTDIDLRPPGFTVAAWPGQTRTITVSPFPTGYLTGRTHEWRLIRDGRSEVYATIAASIDGTSLVTDEFDIPALTGDWNVTLFETTGDLEEPRVGFVLDVDRAYSATQTDITIPVAVDTGDIDITLDVTLTEGGGGGGGQVDSVVAGPGVSVDSTDAANPIVTAEVTQAELDAEAGTRATADSALDGRLDVIEAISIATDAELAAAVAAEATLARNADNLTSGTVADARIAATIARDSEVSAAVSASEAGQVRDGDAAGGVLSGTYPNPGFATDMATQAELDGEALLARNADNLTSGTVADARIPGGIARDAEVTSLISAEATARDAAIASAIAALVASAPGLLDTLDEIAAALGDDPNFATTITTALASKQGLDDELTALAGLASAANKLPYFTGLGAAALADFTAFGRSLLDDADDTAARATLGLGSMATQAASAVAITGGSITGITDLAVADGGTGSSTPGGARTNLGLGTAAVADTGTGAGNVPTITQADARYFLLTETELAAIAGLTSAADRLPYFTGSGAAALATFTAAARALLDDADADAMLATLAAVDRENGGLETVVAHGSTGATETIDLAGGNVHTAAQDQACTYTFTGATNGKGCSFTLILTSVTGAATWPASVKWADATPPTLSGVTILTFVTVDGGTTWYGFPGGKAFA